MKDNFNFLKYIKANPLLTEAGDTSVDDLVKLANQFDYYSGRSTHSRFMKGNAQTDEILKAIKNLVGDDKAKAQDLKTTLLQRVKGDAQPEDVKSTIEGWFSDWFKSDAKAAAEAVKTAYQKYGDEVITNKEKYGIDPNITIGNWKTPYKANVNEPDQPEAAPIEYQGRLIDFLRKPAGGK